MIGDDLINDIGGAQSCGMRGVLVRSGKYRWVFMELLKYNHLLFHMQYSESDEHHEAVHPDGIVDNLAHFADMLLQHQPHAHLA